MQYVEDKKNRFFKIKKSGIIYRVLNKINGKSYIGCTQDLKRRKIVHTYQARKGSSKPLHVDIRKFGESNFSWEIVETHPNYIYAHSILEPFYIKKYDSMDNGYNGTSGGEAFGFEIADRVKKKISDATIGRIPWNKGSKGLQQAWNKGLKIGKGKKHTEEELIKMRKTCRNKPIGQFSLDGHLINEYQSQRDAARLTGFNRSGIKDCCNGRQLSAYGYRWQKLSENRKEIV